MGKNPQVISSCFAPDLRKMPVISDSGVSLSDGAAYMEKFPARVICPSLPEYSVIFQEKNIVVFCQTPVLSGVQAIQAIVAEGRAMILMNGMIQIICFFAVKIPAEKLMLCQDCFYQFGPECGFSRTILHSQFQN